MTAAKVPLLVFFLFLTEITQQQCYTAQGKINELGAIRNIQAKIFNGKSFNQLQSENKNRAPVFEEGVAALCSNMNKDLVRPASAALEDGLLGAGATAVVFQATLNDGKKAIKFISFKNYLEKKTIEFRKSLEFLTDDCITAFINAVDKFSHFEIYDGQSNMRMDFSNFKFEARILSDVNVLAKCTNKYVFALQGILTHVAKSYIPEVANEVEVNLKLDNYSDAQEKAEHRSFSKFDYCVVAPNMDVYFVMERLGPSLSDVIDHCPDAIAKDDLEKRLLLILQILYKANKINELGYAHCDIKPQNAMFKSGSDYSEVFLTDFGIALPTNEFCSKGSPFYLAPEVVSNVVNLSILDRPVPIIQTTNFQTRSSFQADAFGAAILLLGLQLDKKTYEAVLNKYSSIHNGIDTIAFKSNFENLLKALKKILELSVKTAYPNADAGRNKALSELEDMLNNVILKLFSYDYITRYPLAVGLYIVYEIFKLAKGEANDTDFVKGLLLDDRKLKMQLGIPDGKSRSNRDQSSSSWLQTSQIYLDALKDIETRILNLSKTEILI